jgi:NADPH2:quinone reductase
MYALVNAPSADGGLVRKDVAEPEPKPHEAVIQVSRSSLNPGEVRLLAVRPEGWRPGQDVAGVIARAAEDGSGPAVGTQVVALAKQWAWAERIAVPTDRIASLPDGVALSDASTLPVAGTTALRTLRLGGNLPGLRVLITGASGGVGRFQVQLAALQAATVTAVADDRYADELRALGATDVVPTPGAADGAYDLVTESVGGESLRQSISRVRADGTVVIFGVSSAEPMPFSFSEFAPGHEFARIQTFMSYAPGPGFDRDLTTLARLVADGRLHAHIGRETDWTEATALVADMRERRLAGKAVMRIADR